MHDLQKSIMFERPVGAAYQVPNIPAWIIMDNPQYPADVREVSGPTREIWGVAFDQSGWVTILPNSTIVGGGMPRDYSHRPSADSLGGGNPHLCRTGSTWAGITACRVYDGAGLLRHAHEIGHNGGCYCPVCDCVTNGAGELFPDGQGTSNISACVVIKGTSTGIWCWNEWRMYWFNEVRERLPGPLIPLADGKRLSDAIGTVGVEQLFDTRFLAIDAPTGCGKTYTLVKRIKEGPASAPWIIILFR